MQEESTKDIVYRGAPPAPPTGASPSTPTPASAPESKRPPLPSFLQGNSEEQQQGALPSRGSFALEEPGAQASKDVVGVDDETERKLWQSILRDSSPVPGRNDVCIRLCVCVCVYVFMWPSAPQCASKGVIRFDGFDDTWQ
jgi:hypothetical protein